MPLKLRSIGIGNELIETKNGGHSLLSIFIGSFYQPFLSVSFRLKYVELIQFVLKLEKMADLPIQITKRKMAGKR